MVRKKSDQLQGTLDLLVLKTLERGAMHGWGITLHIERVSDAILQGGRGLTVSGASSHGAGGVDRIRVGREREQPAGAILSADSEGAEAVDGGAGELEADQGSCGPCAGVLSGEGGRVVAMGWMRRVRGLWHRDERESERDEELRFHLAMREQRNLDDGMTPGEARRRAQLRFGNPAVWRERMSEIDLMLFPHTVLQDVRFGGRLLLRNFGFTAMAVLALSMGIGTNTAAFTLYKAFCHGLEAGCARPRTGW